MWKRTARAGVYEHSEHGRIEHEGRSFWALFSPHCPDEYLGGARTFASAKRFLERLSAETRRETRARKVRHGVLAVPEAFLTEGV